MLTRRTIAVGVLILSACLAIHSRAAAEDDAKTIKLADLTLSAATISQAALALICLVFIVLAIRSFAAARSVEN